MDQRATYRFPTDLEADCRSCSQAWSSRLCNISTTGCMVVCPESGLPDGALLRIRLRGLTVIDGKIIWQHRGHAGIRFVTPLHKAFLEHLGFHEPAGECERNDVAARQQSVEPEPRRAAGGLNAQLVKRMCLATPASNAA